MKLFGQYQLAKSGGLQAIDKTVVRDGHRFLSLQQVNAVKRAPWNTAFDSGGLLGVLGAGRTAARGRRKRGECDGGWHRDRLRFELY